MPLLDHFGFLAPIYDRVIQPKSPEILIRHAKLPTSGSLLDAGGGTGRIAQFLLDQVSQVVIADLSCDMLLQARKKGDVGLVCTPTEWAPFPDQYFSRIIMVDALHHVLDQEKTAQELWRILAPGGYLVIEEPDLKRFAVKLVALAEKLALMRSHFLHAEEIAALFEMMDAEIEIVREPDDFNSWVIIHKGD